MKKNLVEGYCFEEKNPTSCALNFKYTLCHIYTPINLTQFGIYIKKFQLVFHTVLDLSVITPYL